jgi:hypothetical protein
MSVSSERRLAGQREVAGSKPPIVAVELVALAAMRAVADETSFGRSFVSVAVGGAIIAGLSSMLALPRAGPLVLSRPRVS